MKTIVLVIFVGLLIFVCACGNRQKACRPCKDYVLSLMNLGPDGRNKLTAAIIEEGLKSKVCTAFPAYSKTRRTCNADAKIKALKLLSLFQKYDQNPQNPPVGFSSEETCKSLMYCKPDKLC